MRAPMTKRMYSANIDEELAADVLGALRTQAEVLTERLEAAEIDGVRDYWRAQLKATRSTAERFRDALSSAVPA